VNSSVEPTIGSTHSMHTTSSCDCCQFRTLAKLSGNSSSFFLVVTCRDGKRLDKSTRGRLVATQLSRLELSLQPSESTWLLSRHSSVDFKNSVETDIQSTHQRLGHFLSQVRHHKFKPSVQPHCPWSAIRFKNTRTSTSASSATLHFFRTHFTTF
jgi:hypothetical protein